METTAFRAHFALVNGSVVRVANQKMADVPRVPGFGTVRREQDEHRPKDSRSHSAIRSERLTGYGKRAEAMSEAQEDVRTRFGVPRGTDSRFAVNQFFRSLLSM